jgi:hypothetical protein
MTCFHEVPYGHCHCGCGQKTWVSTETNTKRGWVKGEPVKFATGHTAKTGRAKRYTTRGSGHKREHVAVAERVLGRPMPKGADVHHVNENKLDNRPENLVVCQDRSYHQLLHTRKEALEACGHANWRRCVVCKQYDDPSQMTEYRVQRAGLSRGYVNRYYHKVCNARKERARLTLKRRGAA